MTVEPLHQWEKAGLSEMAAPPAYGQGSMTQANQYLQQMLANPQAAISQFTNPMATKMLEGAQGYMGESASTTRSAINPITMQEVSGIQNPYSQALKTRLTEQGDRARAAILANQGVRGGRSFGDTAQGVRQGMLDQELLSKSSDIDYNTYESALGQLQKMRDRTLQGAGQFGNLAGTAISGAGQAQNISNSAYGNAQNAASAVFGAGSQLTDLGRQTVQDRVGAGNYVREYNQGVNDMIGSDILSGIQDEPQKMTQVLNWLKSFESGQGQTGGGANTFQQVGGLAQYGGGLLDYLNKGSSSSAPTVHVGRPL